MNKVMIITGASRGIGETTAIIAAQKGFNVVLAARSEELIHNISSKINRIGGSSIAVKADISKNRDCAKLIDLSYKEFGKIDVLINNAGVIEPISPIIRTNLQKIRNSWNINVLGVFNLTRMALPYLRNSQGKVINVSSGASISPVSGWSTYCMAKAAINHFTKCLALEESNITALALRPGVVNTEMQKTIRDLGKTGMPANEYQEFVELFEQDRLLSPNVTGNIITLLSLYAPLEWSGAYISWDDERLGKLGGSQ